MRIHYWDLSYPANSHIVAGAASDPINQAVVSYRFVTLSLRKNTKDKDWVARRLDGMVC